MSFSPGTPPPAPNVWRASTLKEWMFREEVDFASCSVDFFPWGKGVILLPVTTLIKINLQLVKISKEGGGRKRVFGWIHRENRPLLNKIYTIWIESQQVLRGRKCSIRTLPRA